MADWASLDLASVARQIVGEMASRSIDDPHREARRVLSLAGFPPAALIAEPGRRLDEDEHRAVNAILVRRLAGEPLSRIAGARDFYGRQFRITPATLDPRPESETLVEAALAIGREEGWQERPIRILDIGTGSGVLLVTLLAELPRAAGLGTDVSDEALRIAQANASAHGVHDRARFARRRSLDGVAETADLLVSNPPYVRTSDIPSLPGEVRLWDPRSALDGGADGLDIYREIAARLGAVVPTGWALFEVGASQAEAVSGVFRSLVATERTFKDLDGRVRCVAVRTRHKASGRFNSQVQYNRRAKKLSIGSASR